MSTTAATDDFFDRELIQEEFGMSRSFLQLEEELKDTRQAEERKAKAPDDSKPFGYAFELDGTIDMDAYPQLKALDIDLTEHHHYDAEAQVWSSSDESTRIYSYLTSCLRGTCAYWWQLDGVVDDVR
ncbi:hypothetical protein [Nonomuraea sp. NPDC050643]|uniref:hypothetical protein n=1 Tax=Nonomuraea sp. NPDC050643 TaxID=3155660 RepID=UPI0033DF7E8B